MILMLPCFILGLVPFILLGFLFGPVDQQYLGLIVGVLCLTPLVVLGDRIILALMRARAPLAQNRLLNIADNLACRLGIAKIRTYISYHYPSNIYFMDTLSGQASLVIGSQLLERLSASELRALVLASLIHIRSGEARFRTITSLILCFFYLPTSLLRSSPIERIPLMSNLLAFLTFPLGQLRDFILRLHSDLEVSQGLTLELLGEAKHLESAFAKISHLQGRQEDSFSSFILEGIALGENKRATMLSLILGARSKNYSKP